METHPFANVLPLLEGAAFDSLAADIRLNGLIEPITLFDGQILDGRNRWRACVAAGIEPRFRDFDGGDPLAFVISMNLHRRHLDESQRAMVAAQLATMRQGARTDIAQPPANLPEVSQPAAAFLLNVSERSVRDAVKVRDCGEPELRRAVEQGKLAVSVAAQAAKLPASTQREIAEKAEAGKVGAARGSINKAIRAERETELAAKQAALPDKKHGVVYADPPWRFEVYSEDTGQGRAAESHYPTLSPESIAAIPVGSIAADDCVLFLWTTAPTMPEAFDLLKAWGFAYRSQCVWAKDKIGLGFWFRNQHEILIVAVKGNVPAPAHGAQWPSLIHAPRGRHSEKPAVFYKLIESYFPNLPKIELFARGPARQGWDAWGNEAEAAE